MASQAIQLSCRLLGHRSITTTKRIKFGDWYIDVDRNLLLHRTNSEEKFVEPKVMQLLTLLIDAQGHVVARQDLVSALWPDTIVGDDTLARTISRLRSALGDSASEAKYIQTIPKKGYALNLLATVSSASTNNRFLIRSKKFTLLIISALMLLGILLVIFIKQTPQHSINTNKLKRAEDFYMKFTHHDNETAISLYEKALVADPDDSLAQAGLANALVQRVVRWPAHKNGLKEGEASIRNALKSGQLQGTEAELMLARAQAFAERAVRIAPDKTQTLKSLGFVYSAQGKLELAAKSYQKAIQLNHNEWRSMINLGEIYLIWEQTVNALNQFTNAFNAMQRNYDHEPQHIGPWQPAVGVLIAQLHQQLHDMDKAEHWYRAVLEIAPFEREATLGLLGLLKLRAANDKANELCERYQHSLETLDECNET